MRKLFLAIVALLSLYMTTTVYAQATQLSSKEIKAIEKEAKKSAKKYEKEGYKYFGAGTLEGALTRFMKATAPGSKYVDGTIIIDGANSVTRGESRALSEAEAQLMRSIQIAIKGEINTNAGGPSKEDDIEAQVDIISRRIAGELKGDLVKHFSIYRNNPKGGNMDVIVFITKPDIMSPNNRARLNQAMQDNLEMAKKIRDYVEQPDSVK